MPEQATNGYAPSFQLVENPDTSGPGRIPLDSPVYNMPEPSQEDEFAKTSTEILENFRFFGILMVKEENGYRRIETIKKANAKCIEEIRTQYGPGQYQLRFNKDEGDQERIDFTVKDLKKETDNLPSSPVMDEQFISGLRHDLKEEIRADYEADIRRLQGRVSMKDDELDDKSRKIRELHEEIGQLRSQLADQVKKETQPLQIKIEQLEKEKWDLKDEIRELKTDLKLAGEDEPLSLGERIIEALSDRPEIIQSIGPALMNLLGVKQPQQLSAPTQLSSPEPQRENPDTDNEQETDESTKEQVNQQVQAFATNVINKAVEQMASANPNAGVVKKFVDSQLHGLQARGIKPNAQLWVGIARGLIQVSDQNGFHPEQVAVVIEPILTQFKQAKMVLKTVPPANAADLLINMFGLQVADHEKQFLVKVLEFFKNKVA